MTLNIRNARRKTFDVEFVKVTEYNMAEVATWCSGVVFGDEETPKGVEIAGKSIMNMRQTKAFVGDYILKSPTGFKAFSNKAFTKTFDVVEKDENARDAGTGKFVTDEYAAEHADTTTVETSESAPEMSDAEVNEVLDEAQSGTELLQDADPS